MLAVAALAFIGCSQEVDLQEPKTDVSGTHTLTFVVQKQADTRTAVVEGETTASYVWTEKDDQYFHIYENGIEATEIEMSLSNDNKTATFTATFDDTDTTAFSYTAVYGNEVSNKRNPLIPYSQVPALDSFDPAADVMVSAEPITLDGNAAADATTEFLFKLQRVVSVNKMTLKGLEAGEVVKAVELISTDGYLSARYGFDKANYTGEKKTLTFDYSSVDNAVVRTDGTFPVYFTAAPVSGITFSVKVTTDKRVYLRDDFTSKLTLEVGKFRRFGVNLAGYGEVISQGTVYTLVESSEDLFDGATYIIVGSKEVEQEIKYYALGKQANNNRSGSPVPSPSNKAIVIDNTVTPYPVVLKKNGENWFIIDNLLSSDKYGQYIYNASTSGESPKSYLRSESAPDSANKAEWIISYANGQASIVNVGNKDRGCLVMNYNGGSPLFNVYASVGSYSPISIYVDKSTCVVLADPELAFDKAEVSASWDEQGSFVAPVLSNPHSLAVTYSSSDPEVATVDADGAVTFVGNGTTVITATSEKTETYNAGSAQYTLTITGAPVELAFETIAELNDLAETTAAEYSGKLTNAVVSFVASANAAIIKDATGSITYYKSGHGLKQGQAFSGELDVTVINYNGLYTEITACSATFTGEGSEVAPEVVALSDLIGNYSTYQNAYVKVDDLTVTSVSGQNINVKSGDDTYVVYDNTKKATCVAGDVISVVGTVTKYNTTEEVKVWNVDDLTITQEHAQAEHTVTFTQPAEGGTIAVSVDGAPIESGAKVMEGKVVTLTATVSEGYTFDGWSVSGATVSGNTETATFTVGTSDVTVEAAFKSVSANAVVLEFDFSDRSKNGLDEWPKSAQDEGSTQTYVDDENNEYSFDITSGIYMGSYSSEFYLFLGSKTKKTSQYISLPSVDGHSLVSVEVYSRSGASANATGLVTSDKNGTNATAEGSTKISQTGVTTWTINKASDKYYFCADNTSYNAQVTKLVLTYE